MVNSTQPVSMLNSQEINLSIMLYSFAVVPNSFEVNQMWLQIGYKKFVDAVERLDYLDCVHEKRIENALYHEESKPSTRVGMSFWTLETVAAQRITAFTPFF